MINELNNAVIASQTLDHLIGFAVLLHFPQLHNAPMNENESIQKHYLTRYYYVIEIDCGWSVAESQILNTIAWSQLVCSPSSYRAIRSLLQWRLDNELKKKRKNKKRYTSGLHNATISSMWLIEKVAFDVCVLYFPYSKCK